MIRSADEIPITYLNKGQAYTMSVFDTMPLAPSVSPIKYRTFVRVSFEDEQQRAKPGACWQLWKEGRGTNEAHQRGGRLLAVEYVDPNQGGDNETRRPQIELESASFDGFCVTWVPNPSTGSSDCSIAVRFNFLSTDFSHSKGVKGIPVRLCAKTEMIMPSPTESSLAGDAEVCFSKVKLFRDHGAERKLSNDVAHVKKTIEKLKQQLSQAESGLATFGKRKRSGSMAKPVGGRPGKILKHKRTWSIDSDGEGSGRLSAEEDMHVKLAAMQDMFTSTRPVSVLYLRGAEQDDPDLFPVHLSGEQDLLALTRQGTWESKQSAASSPASTTSPTSSSMSTITPNRKASTYQEPPPSGPQQTGIEIWPEQQIQAQQSTEQAIKVPKRESAGTHDSSIFAIGVDVTYEPVASPPTRPGKSLSFLFDTLLTVS
jgi:CP2 transcription factor